MLVLVLAACGTPRARGDVERWGTLRGVLREGDVAGKVDLASVSGAPGSVGLGALEGLAGEITVLDGVAWVSRAEGADVRTQRDPRGERAAFLALARIDAWREVALPEGLDLETLEELLARLSTEPALAARDTWPFVVEAEIDRLEAHVLAGGCPFAEDERLRREPHRFQRQGVRGILVGFFTRLPAGVIAHHGSRTHVHVLLREPDPRTGHVDGFLAGPGVLRIPR